MCLQIASKCLNIFRYLPPAYLSAAELPSIHVLLPPLHTWGEIVLWQFLKNPPFHFSCSSPNFFFTSKMADSNWGWNEKSENKMNLGFSQPFELPHLCDTLPRPKVLKNTPKSACLSRKLSNLGRKWEAIWDGVLERERMWCWALTQDTS